MAQIAAAVVTVVPPKQTYCHPDHHAYYVYYYRHWGGFKTLMVKAPGHGPARGLNFNDKASTLDLLDATQTPKVRPS